MNTSISKRRATYLLMVGAGTLCLLAGLILLFGQITTPVLAQADAEATPDATPAAGTLAAEYVGSRECFSCHRGDVRDVHETSPHALALQQVSENGATILADLSGNSAPEIQFPGEDAPRKLTEDDIAYVIGAGRKVQRYLYDPGDEQYLVLPYEWDTVEQVWKPYSPGHPWPDPSYDWKTNCVGCHTSGLDKDTGEWSESGVQCEACHGPGSAHIDAADEAGRRPSEEETLAIRAAIYISPDAQMCGQCHGSGVSTVDNLPYASAYLPGANLLDTYELVAPDDSAHWWPTGHAKQVNMQFNEWVNNAHSSALDVLKQSEYPADDTCLTCHSADAAFAQRQAELYDLGDLGDPAPAAVTLENAQFGVTCIACHAPHKANEDGERVKYQTGIEDIYGLCTQCHSNQNVNFVHHPAQEMFEGQQIVPNVQAVPSSHFTEENGPRCTTCHMAGVLTTDQLSISSHSLQPVLPGPAANVEGLQDSCLTCHKRQVNALQMQQLVDDVQADTRSRLDAIKAAMQDITADWAKNALAFVEGDGSLGIHNYAYTDALLDAVEAEVGLDKPDTGSATSSGS
jgi:hypothetical protein